MGVSPAGVTKGGKNRERHGVVADPPLRVPLYAEGKAPRLAHGHGLDQAIGRGGLDDQAGTKPCDALGVQGVDRGTRGAGQAGQEAPGSEAHRVRRAVLAVEGGILVLAVIGQASLGLHSLVQRAAKGHVQFLEAAADGEQRQPRGDGRRDQRERRPVAVRVVQRAGRACGRAVAGRLDVRRTPRQQQAIDGGQHIGHVQAVGQHRDAHRQRARAVRHGGEVLLALHVERMGTEHAAVGDDPDNGSCSSHAASLPEAPPGRHDGRADLANPMRRGYLRAIGTARGAVAHGAN
jgi:hypothetical protein